MALRLKTRQAIAARVKQGELLAIRHGRNLRFRRRQFDSRTLSRAVCWPRTEFPKLQHLPFQGTSIGTEPQTGFVSSADVSRAKGVARCWRRQLNGHRLRGLDKHFREAQPKVSGLTGSIARATSSP